MAVSVKKSFIDPIIANEIGAPSSKNIKLLKEAETYDAFLECQENQENQHNALQTNIRNMIIPLAVAALGIGASIAQYIKTYTVNKQYSDEAELLINEAAARNEKTTKGE